MFYWKDVGMQCESVLSIGFCMHLRFKNNFVLITVQQEGVRQRRR
jgi:hypothetical protein